MPTRDAPSMTPFEWFQFQCERSTFCVTVEQPLADQILAVLEAAKRWREVGNADLDGGLGAAVDALMGAA